MPDQPGRDRVVALADRDAGIAVDPRRHRQAGLEQLGRQRPQQRCLEREVLPDAHRAVADPAGVIGQVVADQQRVELSHRLDLRDRDQVVAAEPAAFTFDAALLVRALDTGVAVERLEAVVRAERDPPGRLGAVAAEQHPRHRGLEVVVADVEHRRPAQHLERGLVPFQERLLTLGGVSTVDGLA
jgi:hypothetical protein